MIDNIFKNEFKQNVEAREYYLTVQWNKNYTSDAKLSFFEKIKIIIHPFKNPYSPFIYPIRKKVKYYYEKALFNNYKITLGFKKFYLSKINLNNKNMKILDFGCGQGRSIVIMNNLGFKNIIGQDIINFEYWKKLKAKFLKIPLGYIDFYPYKDNSFDLIFSFQVHMYLNEQLLEEHIKNISRILTKNGYFIFEDRNENMLNPNYYTSNQHCPYIHKNILIKKLLHANGLEIIEEKTYGIGVKFFPLFIGILRSLLANKENFDIFDYKPKSWFDKLLLTFIPKGRENMHLIVCRKIEDK